MTRMAKLLERWRLLRAASARLHVPLPLAAWRYGRLTSVDRFGPEEIFMLDLLDGRLEGHRSDFIAKDLLLEWQLALNPRAFHSWTEDKLAFFAKATEAGIATPQVVATLGCGSASEASRVGVPDFDSAEGFLQHLRTCGLSDIILKPTKGLHGSSVIALQRDESGLRSAAGEAIEPAELAARIRASGFPSWLAQQRLKPHPTVAALSATQAVQTLRLVTLTHPDGHVSVLCAYLKLIAGSNITDNFDWGRSGNLSSAADLDTGRIRYAYTMADPAGLGLARIERHPVTGTPLPGFQIPDFVDALDLARSAARALRPLVTIGWDVALTDEGPSVIEGNVTWDPIPLLESWSPIRDALQQALSLLPSGTGRPGAASDPGPVAGRP